MHFLHTMENAEFVMDFIKFMEKRKKHSFIQLNFVQNLFVNLYIFTNITISLIVLLATCLFVASYRKIVVNVAIEIAFKSACAYNMFYRPVNIGK